MMKLEIKVCGPRGSGKSTIMRIIKKALDQHGIDVITEICENINTENAYINLSKNDIQALQQK